MFFFNSISISLLQKWIYPFHQHCPLVNLFIITYLPILPSFAISATVAPFVIYDSSPFCPFLLLFAILSLFPLITDFNIFAIYADLFKLANFTCVHFLHFTLFAILTVFAPLSFYIRVSLFQFLAFMPFLSFSTIYDQMANTAQTYITQLAIFNELKWKWILVFIS